MKEKKLVRILEKIKFEIVGINLQKFKYIMEWSATSKIVL